MFSADNGDSTKGRYDKQDNGLQDKVFPIVCQIAREFIRSHKPRLLAMSAADDPNAEGKQVETRARIYRAMCRKLGRELGYTTTVDKKVGSKTVFVVERDV